MTIRDDKTAKKFDVMALIARLRSGKSTEEDWEMINSDVPPPPCDCTPVPENVLRAIARMVIPEAD